MKSMKASRTSLKRAFSTNAARREEKPIMNRYSRTVTQTKDQGASQVRLYSIATTQVSNGGYARLCCTPRRVSTRTKTSIRLWSVLQAFGASYLTYLNAFTHRIFIAQV